MKAIVCRKYGPPDVLQLKEVAKPAPRDYEVLIRIQRASVFAGDCEMRSFKMHPSLWLPIRLFLGILKPRQPILGQELAGEVEAVGAAVTRFKPGDQIFGSTGTRFGAYAEYVCLPDRYPLVKRPPSIPVDVAASAVVGGLNAMHFIRKAEIRPGEKILIFGAAGSIGVFAVQLALLEGAEVTVVDSADKLPLLRELGATHLIDYRTRDFTENGERYDVIFDIVGRSPYARSLKSLTPNGRYLLANVGLGVMLRGAITSLISRKKVISALADLRTEDLETLRELLASGRIRSAIDRIYPLEAAAEAHRYVESGHKQGHVVLFVDD